MSVGFSFSCVHRLIGLGGGRDLLGNYDRPIGMFSSVQLMAIVTRSINGSINYVDHSVRLGLELG